MREVVLVPGLWMPSAFLVPFAARLSRKGFATHRFGYHGRRPLDHGADTLARRVRERLGGRALHFIGHSLGGLLILAMLERHPELACASVLLLGSPTRGCLAGRRFGEHAFGRWMMGESAAQWTERRARWTRTAPLGVIAGNIPIGMARTFGPLPGESDGVVRVEETEIEGATARAVLPLGHSMLVLSPRVTTLAERFLRTGSFA
jgi:pimeloyl-ACP methyl ester carboxylesterase